MELRRHSLRPTWQPNDTTNECLICNKPFTVLNRRHHCRKCGKIVCDDCSLSRICYPSIENLTLHPFLTGLDLFAVNWQGVRTCDYCVAMGDDTTRVQAQASEQPRTSSTETGSIRINHAIKDSAHQHTRMVNETDDDEQDRNSCPICNMDLSLMSEQDTEAHIESCITNAEYSNSPNHYRSNRMLTYTIPEPSKEHLSHLVSCSDGSNSTLLNTPTNLNEKLMNSIDTDNECVICLEELKPGDKVGRLECLCVYHYKCIKDWFRVKGPGECPVHAVHL